jgi:uncharacterized protein YneF (UPF0154 family)
MVVENPGYTPRIKATMTTMMMEEEGRKPDIINTIADMLLAYWN